MRKENFYTLREMSDQLFEQNRAEFTREMEMQSHPRRSYVMHTPDGETGVSVGSPEDAGCKYFSIP